MRVLQAIETQQIRWFDLGVMLEAETEVLDSHGQKRQRDAGAAGREDPPAGGTCRNQCCECCGSPMEQNRPRDPVVAVEYRHRCNREPLCASCTHYEWGVDLRDRRWWLLTLNAMTVVPRTVARIERPLLATCCICMGTLGTEHDNPERPASISHGRPEGWTTCSSCTFTRVDLGGGRFYWQHSCPNDRPPRTHSRSGREGLRVGANNGCAIEGTVGNGMAQSDPTLDSGGPPLATRSDGNPCAIGLDGTSAVAELPSTSQRLPDCMECWLDAGRHRCPSCGKRPLCGSCLRRHACFPEIDTIASGERKVMCSRASAPQHLGEAGKVLPPECLTVNKGRTWGAPLFCGPRRQARTRCGHR